MIKHLKIFVFLLGSIFLPAIVYAQQSILDNIPNPGNLPTSIRGDSTGGTLKGTISGAILIFLGVVGLISVGYVIYGGFRYVTSGGNSEVTAAAKKTIVNALIGLIIVVLSYVIVRIVTNAAFGTV